MSRAACAFCLAVAVVLDLAGVAAVGDAHPGGLAAVRADQRGDRLDDLQPGRRQHHDLVAVRRGARRSARSPRRRPAAGRSRAASRRRCARICATSQPVHSAVIRRRSWSIVSASAPGQHEQQLRVAAAQRGPPADQALAAERPAERQRAGAGDDRLVQIEERGRGGATTGRTAWRACGHGHAVSMPEAHTVPRRRRRNCSSDRGARCKRSNGYGWRVRHRPGTRFSSTPRS